MNRQRRLAKLSTEQNLSKLTSPHFVGLSLNWLWAMLPIVTVFDSNTVPRWPNQEAQVSWYFRGIFRPTDVLCPLSLNRLDPILRDLAKSGETIDHKPWLWLNAFGALRYFLSYKEGPGAFIIKIIDYVLIPIITSFVNWTSSRGIN